MSIQTPLCLNVDPVDAVDVAAAAVSARKVVCRWPTQPATFVSQDQPASPDHPAIRKNLANCATLENPESLVRHAKFANPDRRVSRANPADLPGHPENLERSKTKWKWKHGQNVLAANRASLDRLAKVVRVQPVKLAASQSLL